jgi:hypothetical protein
VKVDEFLFVHVTTPDSKMGLCRINKFVLTRGSSEPRVGEDDGTESSTSERLEEPRVGEDDGTESSTSERLEEPAVLLLIVLINYSGSSEH